jgi:hypothetical protein
MGEECDAAITARPGPPDPGILRRGLVNDLSFAFMIIRRADLGAGFVEDQLDERRRVEADDQRRWAASAERKPGDCAVDAPNSSK